MAKAGSVSVYSGDPPTNAAQVLGPRLLNAQRVST